MVIELSLKWVKLHISFIQKCNQIHGKRKRYAIVKHTPENIYKTLCVHYLFYLSYLTHPSKQHQRDRKHREVGPTVKVESRSKRSVSGWIRWQSEEKVFHKSRTVETEIISLVELNAKEPDNPFIQVVESWIANTCWDVGGRSRSFIVKFISTSVVG